MRPSQVRARWREGKCAFGVAMMTSEPVIAELIGLLGFDFLWLDLEHSWRSVHTAAELMRAARVGSGDILARPAKGEFLRMGRMLEAGATGVMYPRCESAEEAAEVVQWMKFPPVGKRGLDGAGADVPYASMGSGEYTRRANQTTWLLVQIEDPAALEQVEAIARVDGVDGVFFGPGDFSMSIGLPDDLEHHDIRDATARVAAAARSAGKVWGMPALSVDHARRCLDLGARILVTGTDIVLVKEGYEAIQKRFEPLGFTFRNQLGGGSSPV